MPVSQIQVTIHGDSPGRQTALNGFRISGGRGDRKAYLQAALHSDEQPGIMALHHLLPRLMEAERRGLLNGEFVVFPMVNPLGLGNIEFGMHQGRYDVPSGINFNRSWPDLFRHIEPVIDGHLGGDASHNIQTIRNAVGEWIADWTPVSARDQLRKATAGEAYDADYVFDLHCDNIADVHIFSSPHRTDQMQRLGAALNSKAILTAEDSGGGSFDEVWPLVYLHAQQKYPKCDIPVPVAACTIELRGRADVNDDLGRQDAAGLYAFFQGEGMIGGDVTRTAGETVSPLPLTATEIVRVDKAGLLAYKVELGTRVRKGDVVAELIDLDSRVDSDRIADGAFLKRTEIVAGTDGFILSINANKYVWPGCSIAKIVGEEPLASRGDYLLED